MTDGRTFMLPERLFPDERFDVTPSQAVDIAHGWRHLLADNDLGVLAVEQAVVNDDLRLAGTLDRIVRLGRPLTFGDVTIPAGTVVVLDIKTSKLHANGDGLPSYWDSYPIQVAAYAGSTPYDCDADERRTWDNPIDQQHALIAHLDVEHLIATGEVRWSLLYVDLEVGRQGIAAVQAAQAYHAMPKFKIATDAPSSSVTTATVEPPADDAPPAAPVADKPQTRRDALRERRVRIESNAIDTGWHTEFVARWNAAGITADSTDDEIAAALDALEPPFDPDPAPPHGIERPQPSAFVNRVDDGAVVDHDTVAHLVERIRTSDARATVNAWLTEAPDGQSWSPRVRPYVRQWEISRAALTLAEVTGLATDADDVARAILAAACATPSLAAARPAVGAVLATLTIAEARAVVAICDAFGMVDDLGISFDHDGRPVVVGDVAAVLAAA